MSEQESLEKLETLIEFFKDYNKMLSNIERALKIPLAA